MSAEDALEMVRDRLIRDRSTYRLIIVEDPY